VEVLGGVAPRPPSVDQRHLAVVLNGALFDEDASIYHLGDQFLHIPTDRELPEAGAITWPSKPAKDLFPVRMQGELTLTQVVVPYELPAPPEHRRALRDF
jgi:hypothetical protein